MLDNQTPDSEAPDDLIDPPEVIEAPEEDELSITIEGEDAPADDDPEGAELDAVDLGEGGRRALQAMRKATKDAQAKARAAEAALAAERAAKVVVADEPAPERPTIEGCGYNTEVYDQKLRDYFQAEAKQEAKKAAAVEEAKAADDDYQVRIGGYVSGKAALRAPDMDTAEQVVRSKLSVAQQSILIRCSDDAAKVVLALGRSSKALDDLAKIKDTDRFASALTKLEGKITVTQKSPPPPESKLRGGGGSGGSTSFASQLAAAEKEAERTNDRSVIAKIRREMKAAGVKA